MASVMGSDVTPNGIKFQFTDRIKPTAKKQEEMRSAGLDPKDIDLDSLYSLKHGGKTGRNISKYFGKDSTKGGIEFQFRTIKADAKRQKACADSGGDPQTLGIGSGAVKAGGSEIALRLNDGTTAAALQHRFRPIKKDADAMNAAIAGGFGDADGAVKKATPAKRAPKGTPRGKKAAAKPADGDDDEEMIDTPTKGAMNKVKNGRIGKTTPSRARGSAKNYMEADDEDDEEVNLNRNTKTESDEDISSPGYSNNGHSFNGNGHSFNGNGHNGNGVHIKTDHDDNDGYDGNDLFFEAIDDDDA
ncbi:hypothetical protein VTL71DRAFT_5789 [Oculimacula yallundae]|uniref:Uncharacterized protein n=1 Tax=Oculimacula yallundae TaxID=86028 RepID=A0ABR4BZH9_9HELO